jgi:hemerythrin
MHDFIRWGPDLELGIPELDAQHRKLVDLSNRLYSEHWKEAQGEGEKAAIAELFSYAATHFADEEKYFSAYNFPSLEKHKSAHAWFIARAIEFEERLALGSPAQAAELLVFLESWIKRHIQRDDRELVRIARRIGQVPLR